MIRDRFDWDAADVSAKMRLGAGSADGAPADTYSEIDRTLLLWLKAGVRLIWLVDPELQTITVYRSPTEVRILAREQELSGEDVVPGFTCPVAELFASLKGT